MTAASSAPSPSKSPAAPAWKRLAARIEHAVAVEVGQGDSFQVRAGGEDAGCIEVGRSGDVGPGVAEGDEGEEGDEREPDRPNEGPRGSAGLEFPERAAMLRVFLPHCSDPPLMPHGISCPRRHRRERPCRGA